MADLTYQANVYRQQGGDRFVVREAGYMNFFDQDFTGSQMKFMLLSQATVTNIVSSGSVLSINGDLVPAYGAILFSAATGCSKCSARFPSANVGAYLFLNFAGFAGDANISLIASGVSVVGLYGTNLSVIVVSAAGALKLVCETAGEWQVIEENASVTEQALA